MWTVPTRRHSGYFGAILNASESFAVVAMAPDRAAAGHVAGGGNAGARSYGIEALAWSVVVGYVLELAMLCGGMRWQGCRCCRRGRRTKPSGTCSSNMAIYSWARC